MGLICSVNSYYYQNNNIRDFNIYVSGYVTHLFDNKFYSL